MNFITIQYIIFLIIVFALWNILPIKSAKTMLTLASFFFYAYWFPPYLIILLTIGSIAYFCARNIGKNPKSKKLYLMFTLTTNLLCLGFFKYFNFFVDSFYNAGDLFGLNLTSIHLEILLPLGISFYTFQAMSYVIDVYRGTLKPCDNMIDFFTYLSFFAQLVAGPIVRAIDFIPQLNSKNKLTEEDVRFFIHRFSRGFFLKTVIANNIAQSANSIFRIAPENLTMVQAWYGAIFFSIQILCDFAGYSDIAIASARLLGLRIKENFDNPYLASNLGDFWKRWHISLTTWFKDYLYISLGGNRSSKVRTLINIMVVFILSGIWHGANWTFFFWGFIHGCGLIIEKLLKNISLVNRLSKIRLLQIFYSKFILAVVVFAWVPFRAISIEYTFAYWKTMLFAPIGSSFVAGVGIIGLATTGIFLLYQFVESLKNKNFIKKVEPLRYIESLIYVLFIILLKGSPTDFIYFQF